MTEREALKLALEALEKSHTCPLLPDDCAEAITAIKEALAQPEQEPVTWRYKIVDVFGRPAWTLKTPKSDTRVLESQPLYTTPPQRKPLTDEEIEQLIFQSGGHKTTQNLMSNPMQVREYVELWNERIYAFARAIEAAHGIKGEA